MTVTLRLSASTVHFTGTVHWGKCTNWFTDYPNFKNELLTTLWTFGTAGSGTKAGRSSTQNWERRRWRTGRTWYSSCWRGWRAGWCRGCRPPPGSAALQFATQISSESFIELSLVWTDNTGSRVVSTEKRKFIIVASSLIRYRILWEVPDPDPT